MTRETLASGHRLRAWILLAAALAVATPAAVAFRAMHEREPIIAGPGVTAQAMLGDYAPELAGTSADTPVFVLEGEEPGGTMLLLGGTHPQEVSGLLAAVLLIENAGVEQGRLIIVPQANASGFTHTEPLEGFPHSFTVETPAGERWFRNGMRLTNPIHQWPDPDLYVHAQSAERMVGWESRNLNRTFPGDEDGRYTARVARALVDVARAEEVDLVLDMHEAYPEYPIINMLVAHERAFEIATLAMFGMQMRGIAMDLMASPPGLRGLSHREFGDHTDAYAMLSETANPAMGRFRGRTDESLILEGQDENYVRAAGLGRLFVPFTAEGHPLRERVGRQIATVQEIVVAYNDTNRERQISLSEVPPFERLVEDGLGSFLLPPPRE
jgi:Succinylglutamate desuccinylase / Aspartoacylase family